MRYSMIPLCLAVALGALPLTLPIARAGAQEQAQTVGDAAEFRLTAPSTARPRDAAEIEAAARRYAPAVRHCYQEEGLKEDPTLSGLLRVSITVDPAGDVRLARVTVTQAQGLGMPAVVSCVTAATASWRFAAGSFRAERVGLSFRLRAADRS